MTHTRSEFVSSTRLARFWRRLPLESTSYISSENSSFPLMSDEMNGATATRKSRYMTSSSPVRSNIWWQSIVAVVLAVLYPE